MTVTMPLSLNESGNIWFFFFFFRMLAQSCTPNIYTPTPIPLLYNPFTIVLHKRRSAYISVPSCEHACLLYGNKAKQRLSPLLRRSQSGTRIIGPIPRVCEFRIKSKETDCSVKKKKMKVKSKLKNVASCF